MEDLREDLTSVSSSHWGYPHPISMNSKGGLEEGPATHQSDAYLSPNLPHADQAIAAIYKFKTVCHV